MFGCAMCQSPDIIEQYKLLSWVTDEINVGRIRTTVDKDLSPNSATNVQEGHRKIESGKAKGKIVVDGF